MLRRPPRSTLCPYTPLFRSPLRFDGVLELVERLASDLTAETQRSVFREIERYARGSGLGAVVDGWEPDVTWLRGEIGRAHVLNSSHANTSYAGFCLQKTR